MTRNKGIDLSKLLVCRTR